MKRQMTKDKYINKLIEQQVSFCDMLDDFEKKFKKVQDSFYRILDKTQPIVNRQIKAEFYEMADEFLEFVNSGRWPKIVANQMKYESVDPMILYKEEDCYLYISIGFYLDNKIIHVYLNFFRYYNFMADLTTHELQDDTIAINIYEPDGSDNFDEKYEGIKQKFAAAFGSFPSKGDDLRNIEICNFNISPETSLQRFYEILDTIESKIL